MILFEIYRKQMQFLTVEQIFTLLIDVDLYWQLVKGEVKRTKNCNLVARNSIFAG